MSHSFFIFKYAFRGTPHSARILCGIKNKIMNILQNIIIIAIILNFISCSKSPKCWGENKNSGIIINSVDISCLPNTEESQILILDDSTYQSTFQDLFTGEIKCELPTINFSNESLLGFYGSGQCNVKFKKDVTSDENNSQYIYKLTVIDCGSCKSMGLSYNWVTVPNLPDDWTVTYEIEEK